MPTFGGDTFGAGPFGGYTGRPKITYTDSGGLSRTISFTQHPSSYLFVPRAKTEHVVMDSGVVEVDFFHARDIYTLRFEMLANSLAGEIRYWFEDRACKGYSFSFYRHSDQTEPTVTGILDPGESSPGISPNGENPSMFIDYALTFWEYV